MDLKKKSHFLVGSFVKHLLCHQNYFGVDYPLPPIMSYPPINIEIFSIPPLFSILKTPYPYVSPENVRFSNVLVGIEMEHWAKMGQTNLQNKPNDVLRNLQQNIPKKLPGNI